MLSLVWDSNNTEQCFFQKKKNCMAFEGGGGRCKALMGGWTSFKREPNTPSPVPAPPIKKKSFRTLYAVVTLFNLHMKFLEVITVDRNVCVCRG